ncbi:hypothetical protein C8R47DRAFT_983950 [Mycena vitilis]|nr:hypothetical protein C8R47DRAFT_983950 [Mycena vitilis]
MPVESYPPPSGPPPYAYRPSGSSPQLESYPARQTSSPNKPNGPPSGVHLTRDAEYLIESFLPAPDVARRFGTPKLPLPYCAPQLMPAFDAPFCRAYNTTLETVDISQEQLLAFVDGLNLAMTASPPLRVVNLVGMAIGFVPYHWAMIAGAAIQTGAKVGMRVLSKTLTDRYLRAANLRLFKPRGLSVRICTTAAVQHLIVGTPIAPPPSKITRVGRGVGTVLMKVPIPLASLLVHAVADKPPTVGAMDPASRQSKKLLAAQRRAAMLQGYALPLDFDMPKPVKPEGMLDTVASWGVRFDSWRDGRSQAQAEDLRLEYERQQSGGPIQSSRGGGGLIGGLLSPGSEQRGSGRRGERRQQGLGGGGGLIGGLVRLGSDHLQQRGRRKGPIELQVADADLIEHWKSTKVLWVVIVNSELDEEIDGIELAESREDEERVDERTWQAEMNVEREDREFDVELEHLAEGQAQKS